jgi:flagellar M-ring protein FliF
MATGDRIGDQIKNLWGQMSLARRLTTVGLLVGTLALIGLLILQARRANYQVLFSDLDPGDASSILEQLQTRGVSFQLSSDGSLIRVPADKVAMLRVDLAAQGLPSGGNIGFDIFDRSALGWTDFMQRQNLVRALQGELARTVRDLGMVQSARVHVTLPEESVFLNEQSHPSASVLVRLKPGQHLTDRQVQGIIQLVAHAVPDLSPDAVTVVDADRGESLSPPPASAQSAVGVYQEGVRRAYEEQRAKDIVAVLEPFVGPGHVIARVAATFDFTQQVTEARTLDRPVNTRTMTETEVTGNGAGQPQGAIGSDSALGETAVATTTGQGGSQRQRSETEYQSGETRTQSSQPGGRLVRQTASVILHNRAVTHEPEKPGEKPTVTYEPWSQEDISRFEQLVKGAIGFRDEGGDQVTVVSLPFQGTPEDEFKDDTYETIARRQWIMALLRMGLLAGAALVLFFFVLRPVTRQVIRPALLPEGTSPAQLVGARVGDIDQLNAQIAAQIEHRPPPPERRQEIIPEDIVMPEIKDEGLNRSIRVMTEQNPTQAAQIIKSWLEGSA